jgi:predicted methyltransferase
MKRYLGLKLVLILCLQATGLQAATSEQALAKPGRLEADVARDERSQPAAILTLLNLQAGDRVVDIFAGGGYYSELMATLVGEDGEVLLHNNEAYRNFVGKALEERFSGREPGNITRHDREVADLDLGENSLDAAIIIMSYHDLYHSAKDWPAIDSADFLGQVYRALKPGGRFLIVDHVAEPGSGKSAAQDLHRIDIEFASRDITANGFELIGGSEVLRNPEDDYSKMVFDPAVRGNTDRFVLLFVKPE